MKEEDNNRSILFFALVLGALAVGWVLIDSMKPERPAPSAQAEEPEAAEAPEALSPTASATGAPPPAPPGEQAQDQ